MTPTPLHPDRSTEPDATDFEVFPFSGDDHAGTTVIRSRQPVSPADGVSFARGGETHCPTCAAPTVNGTGLFACTECNWVGPLG